MVMFLTGIVVRPDTSIWTNRLHCIPIFRSSIPCYQGIIHDFYAYFSARLPLISMASMAWLRSPRLKSLHFTFVSIVHIAVFLF